MSSKPRFGGADIADVKVGGSDFSDQADSIGATRVKANCQPRPLRDVAPSVLSAGGRGIITPPAIARNSFFCPVEASN